MAIWEGPEGNGCRQEISEIASKSMDACRPPGVQRGRRRQAVWSRDRLDSRFWTVFDGCERDGETE
jgi:hypothetical protein